ncbi:MAG: 50S ribosomal protein L6 [Candidatus Nanohaloarchaeota archaeon QJJ-5]|nr:50S ribosomal protein L6 [Candidatus Nanohaloarchaeota archaeon QJJ-5]
MEETIEIPDNVDVTRDGDTITVAADGDTIERTFTHGNVDIDVGDDTVTITTTSDHREDKAVVGTFSSHIENMIDGVTDGYRYELKTKYAHFPMSVKTDGNDVVIQNFIGERSPRRVPILEGVSVTVDDDTVIVEGPNKDTVSQTAANIEQECHKGKRDPRKFQDGIYLSSKGE